jgi:hypothetical protein
MNATEGKGVLVWIMSDGSHRDMIATVRSGDGKWLTIKWDYRADGGMVGFGHNTPDRADETLADWTQDLEENGSTLRIDPTRVPVLPPARSDNRTVIAWWEKELRPAVIELGDGESDDLECTLFLPFEPGPGKTMMLTDLHL